MRRHRAGELMLAFDESEHPRDEAGKFTSGGGGGSTRLVDDRKKARSFLEKKGVDVFRYNSSTGEVVFGSEYDRYQADKKLRRIGLRVRNVEGKTANAGVIERRPGGGPARARQRRDRSTKAYDLFDEFEYERVRPGPRR